MKTISDRNRQKHISFLKSLTAFAPGQGYMPADPWAAFKLVTPKTKHSAQSPRGPFSSDQIELILNVCRDFDQSTIDRWAPLLAAYQGARREEIAQLRRCDVFEIDGVWVMRITDAGAGQKVKNAASLRTIPLHSAVIAAGFVKFVEVAQDEDREAFLFKEPALKKGKLREMYPDARGRLSEHYGKRFSRLLRTKLEINDRRKTFHSFRHSWEDATEDANIPQTHRRELAGRSKAGDSQAGYGDGPKLSKLRDSLNKLDPLQ